MSVLSKPYFHNEAKAFEYLESILWADGVLCPHCGTIGGRLYELKGKTTRLGLKKCGECRQQFTVKVGTVFEHGRMPLNKMLQAVYLMTASKKGISAHQMHRILEISYKSAWFLMHRIRHAITPGGSMGPPGGTGKTVEADETELARSRKTKRPEGFRRKTHNPIVVSLVECGGDIRSSFLDHRMVMSVVRQNVHPESRLSYRSGPALQVRAGCQPRSRGPFQVRMDPWRCPNQYP